jgi:hypothetical protein
LDLFGARRRKNWASLEAELRDQYHLNKVDVDTMVCREGTNQWFKISELPDTLAKLSVNSTPILTTDERTQEEPPTQVNELREPLKLTFSGSNRLAIFLSAIWLICLATLSLTERELALFFGFGLAPIVFFWGIWWVVKGFFQQSTSNFSLNNLLKVFFKLLTGMAFVAGIVGGAVWVYLEYENRPRTIESLAGLSLGMSLVDVKIKKGAPDKDSEPSEIDGEFVTRWAYGGNDPYGDLFFLMFNGPDAANQKLAIICYSRGVRKLPFGIDRSSYESEVINKLGNPTRISIGKDGLSKFMSYKSLKVAFEIEKGTVAQVCISESGRVVYLEELADAN